MDAAPFFAYARERYNMLILRRDGQDRPWTLDPILQNCRFTNVFREDDRTTIWFREMIREPMRATTDVLLATVIFRWFNRITTGEALFCQRDLVTGESAFDEFVHTGGRHTGGLRAAIRKLCGGGPYVTGAFIINTPTGMSKLDGVLWAIGEFAKDDWRGAAELWRHRSGEVTLESAWEWLRTHERMGDFMAYEVVTDLRHTNLLCDAPDIMTWANPGPGAKRGLQYLCGGDRWTVPPEVRSRQQQIELMREILTQSRYPENWPADWPLWEMREVEHTLCEVAKYLMVKTGQGKTKGVYR